MWIEPKIFTIAFIGGTTPALIWLWFWLKEGKESNEPPGLLTLIFILGMLAVIFVYPMQKFVQLIIGDENLRLVLWAGIEEMMKYLAVMLILWKSRFVDEPVDWPIFLITSALGFAALENTLFLIKPISLGETTVGILTGQLRFLGSTLLHAVSSGIIGISIGLAFYSGRFIKAVYLFLGIIFAIILHSVFNFFIMYDNGGNFLRVLAFLWVVTIIVMLLFEKLRRMSRAH